MKISIVIDTGNAAFDPYPEEEVERILKDLPNKIRLEPAEAGKIYDINGNSVGVWEVVK